MREFTNLLILLRFILMYYRAWIRLIQYIELVGYLPGLNRIYSQIIFNLTILSGRDE